MGFPNHRQENTVSLSRILKRDTNTIITETALALRGDLSTEHARFFVTHDKQAGELKKRAKQTNINTTATTRAIWRHPSLAAGKLTGDGWSDWSMASPHELQPPFLLIAIFR